MLTLAEVRPKERGGEEKDMALKNEDVDERLVSYQRSIASLI